LEDWRGMNWLVHNPTFWSAFLAWMAAQAIKLLTNFVQTRKFDFSYFVSTGGMPSAHSAMVCGLTASVAIREGTDGALFATTLAFALVVMFDAQSVRRAAGQQARLLNQIVEQLMRTHHVPREKLGELLGHTRMEVAAGMLLGICVAFLVHAFVNTLGAAGPA
jgi:acid phosphatase family membrane protein YuiD